MSITLQEALQRTIEHREIFHDEMLALMRKIMSGEATPVMIAALTVGLRVKKETVGEIAAAAQVMREFATKVEVPERENLLDVVGTGGTSTLQFAFTDKNMFWVLDDVSVKPVVVVPADAGVTRPVKKKRRLRAPAQAAAPGAVPGATTEAAASEADSRCS